MKTVLTEVSMIDAFMNLKLNKKVVVKIGGKFKPFEKVTIGSAIKDGNKFYVEETK